MEAINPCPFCGSYSPYTEGDSFMREKTGTAWVVCEACQAQGPIAEDENDPIKDAIIKWNSIKDLTNKETFAINSYEDLYEELLNRYIQTKCGCGHPACNRCKDDKETEKVLARARGNNNAQG